MSVTAIVNSVIELLTSFILLGLAITPVVSKKLRKATETERMLIVIRVVLGASVLFSVVGVIALLLDSSWIFIGCFFISCLIYTICFCRLPFSPLRIEIFMLVIGWNGFFAALIAIPGMQLFQRIIQLLEKL